MRSLAILLASYVFLLGLLPQMDGSQLIRLGQLWQHFDEHRIEVVQLGEDLSFLHFLAEHYLAPDSHEHPDHSQHEQLPFQHFGASPVLLLTPLTELVLRVPGTPAIRAMLGYRNVFFAADFEASIVQPPSRP